MDGEQFHRERVLKVLVWFSKNGPLLVFVIYICVVPFVLVKYHYSPVWSMLGAIAFVAWGGVRRRP